jgi:hypothetical protein
VFHMFRSRWTTKAAAGHLLCLRGTPDVILAPERCALAWGPSDQLVQRRYRCPLWRGVGHMGQASGDKLGGLRAA